MNRGRQSIAWGLVALTAIGGGYWFNTRTVETTAPPSSVPVSPLEPAAAAAGFQQALQVGLAREERPASLQGTEVDGDLRVGPDGHLVVDRRVRDLFDYFLATQGEADLDQIRGWVAVEIEARLPDGMARQQAWALFERYLGSRDEEGRLSPHDGGLESMLALMDARSAVRQAWLGRQEGEAFYGLEEAYDRQALERRRLLQDQTLTSAQREAALAALERQWFPDLQTGTDPVKAAAREERLREQGLDEAALYRWRAEQFGDAAAERLARLDREQADWDQRYETYRQALQALADSGLAEEDRALARQRLREEQFSPSEQARVQALDRFGEH